MKLRVLVAFGLTVSLLFAGCSETSDKAPEKKTGEEAGSQEQADKGGNAEAEPAEPESADKASEAEKPVPEQNGAPSEEGKAPEGLPKTADTIAPRAGAIEATDKQKSRQAELQAVYALGRTGDESAVKKLVEVIESDKEAGIRATAIRVLGRSKKPELIETLSKQAKSGDLPVKIEAAILLYQWGEKKEASPVLDELSSQGVALRRAFLTGRENGQNQYDAAAKKYLKKGLKSDNVYTRLDAALGLYEIDKNKEAVAMFKDVMKNEKTFYVRMAALNYLRHLRDDSAVRGIIEMGTKDQDERVAKRANQILGESNKSAPKKSGE